MSKVEFSGRIGPGGSHEEGTFYRDPDHWDPEGSGCRNFGERALPQPRISDATYYNWKSKYGGMSASDLKRLKEMERELSQLKRMYADMAMENRALKDLIEKKL